MSAAVRGPAEQPLVSHALRATRYDRVASWLIALLVVGLTAISFLILQWLSKRVVSRRKPPPIVTSERIQQVGGGISSGIVGESMELNSPIWQDVAGETDIIEPDAAETLATVVEAVATRRALLADPKLMDTFEKPRGGTRQKGTGNRPGYGIGEGYPGLPPHMRWELRFLEGNDLQSYSEQLDYFGIELGVLDESPDVTLVSELSSIQPVVTRKPRTEEIRMFMKWRKGSDLIIADQQLLAKAGVAYGADSTVLQFYPDATEQMLLRLELNYQGIEAGRIKKTVFELRVTNDGYEFEVVSQSLL